MASRSQRNGNEERPLVSIMRSKPTPIYRLPLDILHLIFLHHLFGSSTPSEDPLDETVASLAGYYADLGRLRLVCSSWSNQLDSTPIFWRHLSAELPIDFIHKVLQKAGEVPLEMSYHPSVHKVWYAAGRASLRVFVQNAKRFQSVSIITDEIDVMDTFVSSPFCSPQKLCIHSVGWKLPNQPKTLVNTNQLVSLEVESYPLDWPALQFPNLRHLKLAYWDYSPAQIVGIIRTMPKLRNLILLYVLLPELGSDRLAIAPLTELETLYLADTPFVHALRLLDTMAIPSSAKITLKVNERLDDMDAILNHVIGHACRQEACPNPRVHFRSQPNEFDLDFGFCRLIVTPYEREGDIVYRACENVFDNIPQHIRNLPTRLHWGSFSAYQTTRFLPLFGRYYNVNELVAEAVFPYHILLESLSKPQLTSSDE
ncbi:hypothetical protein FRB99_002044, partial [Tulasnella sp. 403]